MVFMDKQEAVVREKYAQITNELIRKNSSITTMESCTCGLVASLITDTEGASAILKGAFITYSNEAKVLQGVPAEIIDSYGVYSEETAVAMAKVCRQTYHADIGVGVTGSFGNVDPANPDSIPGEVWFAVSVGRRVIKKHCSIPAQPSRFAYKLYMADRIADVLLAVLELQA